MKNILSVFIFLLTVHVFSQTPVLFYEDGSDHLGPIEIRNDYVYYIAQQEGLKQVALLNPTEAQLLVNIEEIPRDIKYFFWNPDESYVYFGDVFNWFKAPFDTAEISDASLFMDFNSQQLYDLKVYNDEYFFTFSDFGSLFFRLTDIDPYGDGSIFGDSGVHVKNIAVADDIIYYDEGTRLHRAEISSFNTTKELLIDVGAFIDQLEVHGNLVYVLFRDSNSITIFDTSQSAPWIFSRTITLDPEVYQIENITLHDNKLYFTDNVQGAIFFFPEEVLSVKNTSVLSDILITPNPVADILTLQMQGLEKLHILDVNGRIITTYIEDTMHTYLDVSFLAKGMYIAHFVMKDEKNIFKRFIKK
ncbi:T9SS type A sorting domain-containing protein [uncultured Dokdonia sp.]|uniref:T9SS type A sorting domain-containing protein n=1 Tax=uncultured Dokdonia sp. TaxID=575653 RepID=UPI00262F40F2|nr:T9SS type A sorting domain-containing protein [uncultured Dokdonia sp.]